MNVPKTTSRMSATDAAFLYLERKEVPLNIASVCIFDGPIPLRQFVASISAKLSSVPRYQQIPSVPAWDLDFPVWVEDPHFDVRRHIIPVTLPPPGGEAELQALAGRLLSQRLDRNKPLWDVHVINGLKGGRGALIFRVHHALADGVSGEQLMKILLDATPQPSYRRPRPCPRKFRARTQNQQPSLTGSLSDTLNSTLAKLIDLEAGMLGFAQAILAEGKQASFTGLAELLAEFTASIERLPFNKPCTGERSFCWAEFSMADVQAIRESAGGTVNDVILAVVTRALGRYVKLHGQSVVNRFVRVVCPVNLRLGDQDRGLGNQIAFLPVALPLDARGPIHTLQAVVTRTETLKRCGALGLVALAAKWFAAAPPLLQALFWRSIPEVILPVPLLNIICTNVIGSVTPLYAVGRRMVAAYPQVPTGWDLGVGLAAHSYDGKLFFGLVADTHAAPDADRLRDFLVLSFHELRRSAALKRSRSAKRAARSAPSPSEQSAEPVPAEVPASISEVLPDGAAVKTGHSKEAA